MRLTDRQGQQVTKDAGRPTVIADKLVSIDHSAAHVIPKITHTSRLLKNSSYALAICQLLLGVL